LRITNRDHDAWLKVMSVERIADMIDAITVPRPGHAEYAAAVKYGYADLRNAIERASARETAMRVACGTIVRKLLEDLGLFIGSHVIAIGNTELKDRTDVDRTIRRLAAKASCAAYKVTEEADRSAVRMLDAGMEAKAIAEIKRAKKAGDTLGGIFEILVTGVPIGLGSHVHFDRKLDGQLAQALMSIHAVKGVEIGEAFANARLRGSQVHDAFMIRKNKVTRPTNRAGGLEGGISNGEMIVLRAAMKPIATLAHPLRSVDVLKLSNVRARYERSDVCAVPACSVIGEAVVAPVLASAFLEKFGGDSLRELTTRLKGQTVHG
jgi:chorismate synthase